MMLSSLKTLAIAAAFHFSGLITSAFMLKLPCNMWFSVMKKCEIC